MPGTRLCGPDFRHHRRWSFAGCIFDEGNWALIVRGKRVPMETKPLELLRELLMRAGHVVSKDELLDRIWPDVVVVEASLPTAIRKLRLALGEDRRRRPIIETVPGIGYRLAVPVEVEDLPVSPARPTPPNATHILPVGAPAAAATSKRKILTFPSVLSLSGALAVAAILIAFALAPSEDVRATKAVPAVTQRDAQNALRKLDVSAVERMLAAGWDPNTSFDDQGNGAVNYVLNMCEWDRGHDQRKMVLMVRTLIEGGAKLDHRNTWGDTAYSIAKAPRYCGPRDAVTESIRRMCFSGYKPLGDRCEASYELARRRGARKA